MALNREKIHQSAQRLVLKGQIDKAIQELKPIFDEDPNDTRTLQKVAELYRRKGACQEAEGIYTRLAQVFARGGFFQRAVAVYNQILQLNPTSIPVHVALGDTLAKLGWAQEANKVYGRTVTLLQRAGRLDEATGILEKLIASNPDSYQARLQLAELLLKAGRNQEAIAAFEEALPTLRTQGRDDLFQRAAERLLFYQPDNLPLCRELAIFHLRRGSVSQAMKLLQYCHKRDPHDVDTLRLLAGHFETSGEAEKAVVVLQQMARVLLGRGEMDPARETYRRILEIRPNDQEAAAALGAGEPLPGPEEQLAPPARGPEPPPERSSQPVPAPRPASPAPLRAAQPPPLPPQPAQPPPLPLDAAAATLRGALPAFEEADAEAASSPTVAAPEALEPPAPAREAVPEAEAPEPTTGQIALAPLPEEPVEVQRIASESDIFVKFGLKNRAVGHLTGGLAQFPQSVLLRDRLIAIYLNEENLTSAVHVMLEVARILAPTHRDHAMRYVQEVLFLDEENAVAHELLGAIESAAGLPAGEALATAELPPFTATAPAPVTADDLDVEIDVAAEPVRTLTVPPLGTPAIPVLVRPVSPVVSGAPPSWAKPTLPPPVDRPPVIDLPPFDEVETGPPLSGPDLPKFEIERLVVPVTERPAPAVLEMEDESWTGQGEWPTTDQLPTSPRPLAAPAKAEAPAAGRPPAPAPAAAPAVPAPAPPPAAAPIAFGVDAAIRQGLEEIDFFLQQGLEQDARTLAEQLADEYGSDARVRAKLAELAQPAAAAKPAAVPAPQPELEEDSWPEPPPGPAAAPAAKPPAAPPPPRAPAPKAALPAPPAAEPAGPPAPRRGGSRAVTIGSRAVADAIDDALDALQGPAAAAERSAAGGEQEWRPGSGVPLSDATMHFDLGIAYREMGVLDRAIEEFRRAGQDPGREANCQALIGACLVTMGKPKEAVEELKRGLHARHKGDVDELDLYYELANAHLALNDAKEALFYLQAIKRKDPGYRDVARRITALMSASRPGRRPSRPPRASEPPPAAPEDESAIDDAFDDLFKGGRN